MSLTVNDIRRIDSARRSAAEYGGEYWVRLEYGDMCLVQPDGSLLDGWRKPMSLPDNVDEMRLAYQREDDAADFVRELRKVVGCYAETARRYIGAGATDLEPIYKAVDMLGDATKQIDAKIEMIEAENEA